MHQILDNFYSVQKKWSKFPPKNDFVAHFQRFCYYVLLHPMSYSQFFCQMKGLIKIHNRGKFHQYSICGYEVTNFQMVSQLQKVGFQTGSGWFFAHNSPQMRPNFLEIWTSNVVQGNTSHMLRFLIQSSKFQQIKQKKLTFCLVFSGYSITRFYTI